MSVSKDNFQFVACPQCQKQIRLFGKELTRVKFRICPACGAKVAIELNPDQCQVQVRSRKAVAVSSPTKITIIDDESAVRESLGIYSEMLGCRPVLIADLSSYINNQAEDKEVTEPAVEDILVIDQNLPGTTGLDIIQRLQEQGCRIPNQRKAVLSEALSNEEFRRAKRLGCHVLQKPITYEIFENWVAKLQSVSAE